MTEMNMMTGRAMELIREQEVLGKSFRVYGDWESPLFLAKDVAEWIEYAKTGKGSYDTSRMLGGLDDEEKLVRTIFWSGQNREMWFLTEEGLYEVLMQSRKPIAKVFKKEVKAILKEVRKTGSYQGVDLSPQLQFLINMELRQKELERAQGQCEVRLEEQHHALEAVRDDVDSIREIVSLDTTNWRADSRHLLQKIAQKQGGDYGDVYTESYALLDERAKVNLAKRLKNKRKRMEESGVSSTKVKAVGRLDIIEEDTKLVEIYVAIVKEMAISVGVA